MSNILISLPIYQREWILPKWIECIEAQNYPKDKLGFLFELGPDDDSTHNILWDWQTRTSYRVFDAQVRHDIVHNTHEDGHRTWSAEKYLNMVDLRNSLLERATAMQDDFDYYFSLDSDLLLANPESLNILVEAAQTRDVVSPLSYMTPYDTNFPSAMSWVDEYKRVAARKLEEYKLNDTFEVDIVMAAVFMSKPVFTNVRYRWHRQGEDLGFAQSLDAQGFKSYGVWSVYCPHIMHKSILTDYLALNNQDPRDPNFVFNAIGV